VSKRRAGKKTKNTSSFFPVSQHMLRAFPRAPLLLVCFARLAYPPARRMSSKAGGAGGAAAAKGLTSSSSSSSSSTRPSTSAGGGGGGAGGGGVGLVWFKPDHLRLLDNEPLFTAHSECARVLHVFVFDPYFFGVGRETRVPKMAYHRARFTLEAVADLRKVSAEFSLAQKRGCWRRAWRDGRACAETRG
jgi:hypothetical protein